MIPFPGPTTSATIGFGKTVAGKLACGAIKGLAKAAVTSLKGKALALQKGQQQLHRKQLQRGLLTHRYILLVVLLGLCI